MYFHVSSSLLYLDLLRFSSHAGVLVSSPLSVHLSIGLSICLNAYLSIFLSLFYSVLILPVFWIYSILFQYSLLFWLSNIHTSSTLNLTISSHSWPPEVLGAFVFLLHFIRLKVSVASMDGWSDEVSLVADWVKVMFDKMTHKHRFKLEKYVHDVRMIYQNIWNYKINWCIVYNQISSDIICKSGNP